MLFHRRVFFIAAVLSVALFGCDHQSGYAQDDQSLVAQANAGVSLTGRVVTPDGKPIPYVGVHVTVKSPVTYFDKLTGTQTQTVQVSGRDLKTDAQGAYATNGIKAGDQVIIFVNEPGYQYVSGGSLAGENGAYVASDIVTEAPDSQIDGIVKDSSGAPVSGAVVIAPLSNLQAQAISDAAGHFSLVGLPAGTADVFAIGGAGVYHGQCATGVPATLTLSPISTSDQQDISNATSVLTGDYKQATASQYPATERMVIDLAAFDPAAALNLASLNGATPADTALYGIALAVARTNPARAVVVAPDIVSRIVAPGPRAIAASYVGLYLVNTDKDTALKLLEIGKAAIGHSPFEVYGGADQAAVATLASRLGDRNATKLLDDTIKSLRSVVDAMRKKPGSNVDPDVVNTTLAAYAETVAPAGSAMIERVLSQIDPASGGGLDPRLIPRTRSIETLAEFDPADALSMLRKYAPSDIGAPLFGEAAVAVVEQIEKTDAAGALALAQQVTDQEHVPIVLALAARVQPADSAATIFRLALAAALRHPQKSAISGWVCAQAYEVNPTLGKELFSSAWSQLSIMSSVKGGLSPFMFYYYRVDPVTSRRIVEQECASAELAERIADIGDQMLGPVLAMTAMDPNRAVELAGNIPGNARYEALRKVAQYMLATPQIKRTLRFDRWIQPDGWMPGRPTSP